MTHTYLLLLGLSVGWGGYGGGGGTELVWARLGEESFEVLRFMPQYQPETAIRKEKDPDGTFRDVTYTVTVCVDVPNKMMLPRDGTKVHDLAGNAITAERVAEVLKDLTPVLLVPPDQKVDPRYQAVFKPNMLVLTKSPMPPPAPREATPVEPAPPPGAKKKKEPAPPEPTPNFVAPKKMEAPARAPLPEVWFAQVNAGALALRVRDDARHQTTAFKDESSDGKTRKVPLSLNISTRHEVRATLPLGACKAQASGQALAAPELMQRLRTETAVLLWFNGQKAEPSLLALVKEGTPVLLLSVPRLGVRPGHGYYAPVPESSRPLPAPKAGAPVPKV